MKLRNGDGWGHFSVHTLVLTAFVHPRPPEMETRHLNGKKLDNRLENLAWGTRAENAQDKVKHGSMPRGEQHSGAKLTRSQVREIRSDHRRHKEIAGDYGVSTGAIGAIKKRKTWAWLDDDDVSTAAVG
ncbi:MAG: HNH endonuclease signature motif containing protein [Nannocystaceae bacterium]